MNINSTFIPDKPGDIIISYSIPGLDQPIQIPFHSLDSFQTDQAKIALVMGITIGSCSMTLIFLISIMYKTNKLTNLKLNLKLKYILQWINQKIFTKKRNDNKQQQQQQQQQQIESSSYNNTTTTLGGYKLFLFYLNSLILLIGIIRSGCYLNYNLGPLNSLSFVFTGWYDGSSFISSDVTNGFKCILYALVEISLGFQVYVMFKTSNLKIWGIMASLLSIGLGLIVVAFQINLTILSHIRFSRAISTNRSEEESSSSSSSLSSDSVGYVINSIWMDLPTILFSISINIMTILLIGKLIFAIRTRRYLGLKQFDSFHILLIGFSQTLIIPSIILVVHYFYLSQNKDSLLQQISLLLIILMLPLSSLWAQTANNTHNINSSPSLSFISRHHLSDSSRSGGSNTIVSNGGSNGGGGGGGNFPVSGIDAQLPPDIEKILHEDNNYKLLNSNNESVNDGDIIINDEGMITKQITIKRV